MKIISSIILGGSLLLASTAFAAPSPSEQVYLLQRWFVKDYANQPNTRSCLVGQADYQEELVNRAMSIEHRDSAYFTKKSYYSLGTLLGYFSDSPVERDAIVEKVKGTIDKDFAAIAVPLKKANYLLFVGDSGARNSDNSTQHIKLSLPDLGNANNGTLVTENIAYSWMLNSVSVVAESVYLCHFAYSCAHRQGIDWERDKVRLYSNITASSKDWEGYLKPLLIPSGEKVASRLLTDKDLRPLLAEIFDRKTGKTVLSWAADGMDIKKLQALVPETPAADYDFNKCDSLNPDYYKKTLGESNDGSNAVNNAIQGFFGKLMGK
jgi:hypothetical protein